MAGDLMTLPLRLGFRVAHLAVRTGLRASERAVVLATHVVKAVTPNGSDAEFSQGRPADAAAAKPQARALQREVRTLAPAPPVDVPSGSGPPAAQEPTEADPVHVSEEPELVEELAEPGAEDGAGAQVTVAEPWDGYTQMTAKDVIARVGGATPEEVAAVQLYESMNRKRETVVSAVEHELRIRIRRSSTAAAADKTRKEQANG